MLANTTTHYGTVAKALHWLTVLLIFTVIPLGVIAHGLPYDTSAELASKAWLFSLHKTVGVTIFFVALARIVWALVHPHPVPLHPERRAETFAASMVHWVLYGSLVLVPLTGWIHHAATEGFAPILWPYGQILGQNLPLIPENARLAHVFASLHMVFERVMVIAILLHVAGALKHVVIDKDGTLARMWFAAQPEVTARDHRTGALPFVAALVAWGAALGVGTGLGLFEKSEAAPVPQLAAVSSDWVVQQGSLGITVRQLGSEVSGEFSDWTAAIEFDEVAGADGRHGSVEVVIAIGSLSLGSVTGNALEAEFLDGTGHPTARFAGPIMATDGGFVVEGVLALRGVEMPLALPFELEINADQARARGGARIDRQDYGIGPSYPDESTVGFGVEIGFELEAVRE